GSLASAMFADAQHSWSFPGRSSRRVRPAASATICLFPLQFPRRSRMAEAVASDGVPPPYLTLTWSDPESTATGYLVLDRLVTGTATGGTRMRPGCTLEEVKDLAREMTLKAAAFGLPVGGGKGGIDYPADAPDADDVRLRFVQAVRPYLDRTWVTAGDLGTPQSTIDAVFERAGLGPSSLRAGIEQAPDPEVVRKRVAVASAEE